MRACILAFALGVWLLQQQAELPNVRWAWTLLPGGVFALLLSRCRANIFAITGKVLFAGVLLGMGFFWAAVFAQSRLADVLSQIQFPVYVVCLLIAVRGLRNWRGG